MADRHLFTYHFKLTNSSSKCTFYALPGLRTVKHTHTQTQTLIHLAIKSTVNLPPAVAETHCPFYKSPEGAIKAVAHTHTCTLAVCLCEVHARTAQWHVAEQHVTSCRDDSASSVPHCVSVCARMHAYVLASWLTGTFSHSSACLRDVTDGQVNMWPLSQPGPLAFVCIWATKKKKKTPLNSMTPRFFTSNAKVQKRCIQEHHSVTEAVHKQQKSNRQNKKSTTVRSTYFRLFHCPLVYGYCPAISDKTFVLNCFFVSLRPR